MDEINKEHNQTPTGLKIQAYIDRVERLEEDKKAIMEDIKEVFGEAKGEGFDTKAIKKIIKLRKKDAGDRAEEESILETYMASIGMDWLMRNIKYKYGFLKKNAIHDVTSGIFILNNGKKICDISLQALK